MFGLPILKTCLSLVLCTTFGASGYAAIPPTSQLKPGWLLEPAAEWDPNLSILSSTSPTGPSDQEPDPLMSASRALEIRQEYEDMNREYELKQSYDLIDAQSEEAQAGRVRDFSKRIWGEVRNHNLSRGTKEIEKILRLHEDLVKPLAIAVAIASLGTGAPVESRLGEETRFKAAANLPYQTGYFQLSSVLGESSVTLAGKPDPSNAWMAPPPPSWIARDEKYRLTFSRPIPFWGLGSGIAYGGSSNSFSASLSKSLMPNLVATLSSVRPVDETSRVKSPEETLKLDYEIRF